jgi:hypothetical protein
MCILIKQIFLIDMKYRHHKSLNQASSGSIDDQGLLGQF